MPDDEDFQRRSSEEGRVAQDIAQRVIKAAGFEVTGRNEVEREVGVTVNFKAIDQGGSEWFFDVSGSFTSDRAGLIRTDTMWKTLGRANVLSGMGVNRLLLLTTNLPKDGSVGDRAMRAATTTFFDAVEMTTTEGKLRLRRYAEGGSAALAPLPGYRTVAQVYKRQARREPAAPGTISVPVALTGDALPTKARFDVVAMPHRFKVFLPSVTRDGEAIAPRRRKAAGEAIIRMLSDAAGGCTSSEATGSWVDPISGVVHEKVTAIESYSSQPLPPEVIWSTLQFVVHDLEQAAAAVIMDDRMYHFNP